MIRYEEQAYFFQFWPPQGAAPLLETHHGLGSEEVSMHPWLASPYFHMWRFLRESKSYKEHCIDGRLFDVDDPVYRDFGDVHASDDFWTWWLTKGCELFCEPRSYSPHTVDQTNLDEMLKESRDGRRIIISLSLDGDIERTKTEVSDLLKRLTGQTPSRARKESLALYSLVGDPKPVALDRYYRLWRYKQDNDGVDNPEVAVACGLAKASEIVDKVGRIDVSNKIGRMIAKAQSIIDHVHLGVFPVLDKKAAENIEQYLSDRRSLSQLRREEIRSGRYTNPALAYGDAVEPIYLMEAG